MRPPADRVVLYTDGASRGNPGPAGAGVVLYGTGGFILEEISRYLGEQTNNVAEYQAAILGLSQARELGARHITHYLDSQLVVRQITGAYQVRHAALQPLHQQIRVLLEGLETYEVAYIPREQNTDADRLANRAIDRAFSDDAPAGHHP